VETQPRVRVSLLLRWHGRVLLCRQEKPGKEYWLLPGGGVEAGETLEEALHRELGEELGLWDSFQLEGPIAVAESIAPDWAPGERHVVHIVFGADFSHRSLERVPPKAAAVRGPRLFAVNALDDIAVPPPIQRFLQRWRPGDPVVYLGALWTP